MQQQTKAPQGEKSEALGASWVLRLHRVLHSRSAFRAGHCSETNVTQVALVGKLKGCPQAWLWNWLVSLLLLRYKPHVVLVRTRRLVSQAVRPKA